jgi:(1->4)-alpha-D-glucan 1-alpha-D-glucosylmutase
MTATATHDTKRGEDARMRILALAELADDWIAAVREWQRLNAPLVAHRDGVRMPARLHEYMLYQSFVGAWPLAGMDDSFVQRMLGYAVKAAREGKVETSWTNPSEPYETALQAFVRGMLDRDRSAAFLCALERFAVRTARLGALNSLVQLALKATIPGVPDFYQGTELWDLSLVDPDNRRPVDFAARVALQAALQAPDWDELVRCWEDGRIKFALMLRLLQWRSERPALFAQGDYRPLPVAGAQRDHVIAFARTLRRDAAIIIVGRWLAPLTAQGSAWPAAWPIDATVALHGYRLVADRLSPRAPPADSAPAVASLWRTLPVALFDAELAAAA